MFQVNKISNGLLGIVGFRQPYNPEYAILNSDNLNSDSGFYINDNSYAKVEYIKDTQEYANISDANFNLMLRNMQKTSILSVCNKCFSEYDFLDRNLLYKNAFNKANIETLPVGFVGYKIEVSQEKNIAFKINKVILDFQGTGTLTLLLWNTGKKAFIRSKTITIASDNQVEEFDWILDNSETTYKGDYYIGYNTTGLTVSPYKRDWNNSNLMSNFKGLCFESIFVKNHNSTNLFDLRLIDGLSESIGLNLDVSIYEDYTDFILNNRMLFAKAISLEFTIQCLQLYASSNRSSSNQRYAEELYHKIMIEIEGTKGSGSVISVTGLREQILGEISTIKEEIKKLKMGFFKTKQLMNYTLE